MEISFVAEILLVIGYGIKVVLGLGRIIGGS